MLDKKAKVLVTGANGFIGKHACSALLQAGHPVVALTQSGGLDAIAHSGLNSKVGNLNDKDSLLECCYGIDTVVHLAGLAHAHNSSKKSLIDTNVEGTKLLLNAAIDRKVRRIIFVSSSLAATYNSRGQVTTYYGETKLAAERLLQSAFSKGSIEVVILRPVNVYGVGMKGNIASLISLIARGSMPPLPHTDAKISLVGVGDVSEAIRISVSSDKANGKVYTLTDGMSYSLKEIEKRIYVGKGRKPPRWGSPRLLAYSVAFSAEILVRLLNLLGIRFQLINGINRQSYYNLFNENLFDNALVCDELGFKPGSTLYDSLPSIMSSLEN